MHPIDSQSHPRTRQGRSSYARWRHDNPEDTLRYHALRLREAGMLRTSPQELIAKGTDWRFLSEVKRELKS